jgi:acetyl-CoA carboxylase biotin carboxyl carrier protein
MVGTFYRRPSPEDPEFVKIGDSVKKGDVLCIIEAMKVMNEIQSDASGVIVEILLDDGMSVEFGQPLFKIRPS